MNSNEEQAVVTARFGYRMLVTVSLSALFIALSHETPVRDAIEETNTLIRLAEDPISWLRERVFEDDSIQSSLGSFESTARRNGLTLKFNFDLIERSRVKFPFRSGLTPGDEPPSLRGNGLQAIEDYYTTHHEYTVGMIEADSKFERALRRFREEANVEPGDTVHIEGALDQLIFLWSGGDSSVRIDPPLEPKTYHIIVDPLEILSRRQEAQNLFEREHGVYVFLPSLRRFWDEVRLYRPANARRHLAQKYLPDEERFEVFGLSIPKSLVSVTIPALILAISVHFFVHVRFLLKAAEKNSKVLDYPWIGTMSMQGMHGFVSEVALFLSLILLPGCALGALFFRSTVVWKIVTFFVGISAMLLLFGCYGDLLKIRNSPLEKPWALARSSLRSLWGQVGRRIRKWILR